MDICGIVAGSSPRARGTQAEAWAQGLEKRFIPASAGNTFQVLV